MRFFRTRDWIPVLAALCLTCCATPKEEAREEEQLPFGGIARARPTAPAAPEAVAAYREGMQLLAGSPNKANLDSAEGLFQRAAALELPHAYYGLACVIYMKRDTGRYKEALDDARRASGKKVLEAKALLVIYYWFGIGMEERRDLAHDRFFAIWRLMDESSFPIESGAPRTMIISDAEQGRTLLEGVFSSGRCGPALPEAEVAKEQGYEDFRRNLIQPLK